MPIPIEDRLTPAELRDYRQAQRDDMASGFVAQTTCSVAPSATVSDTEAFATLAAISPGLTLGAILAHIRQRDDLSPEYIKAFAYLVKAHAEKLERSGR